MTRRVVFGGPVTMTAVRRIVAVGFVLHAVAHLPGFLSAWRLADPADVPYTTLILNGSLEVGDVGTRIVGVAWLVAAAALLVAAVGLWRSTGWAWSGVAAAAPLSLVVSLVGLPASAAGVAINLVILLGLGLRSLAPARWARAAAG